MTSRDFVYWLQGYFEITAEQRDANGLKIARPEGLNTEQVVCIRKHLALVFIHEIDPSYSDDPAIQQQLNDTHNVTSAQQLSQSAANALGKLKPGERC